ncbi:hypothetical protein B0A48_13466 [Cryoendolithus antarcticus]|uniref:F-box domain-containing protein n=1 Tax=Cryoendolithus antarcticus TaxID=1507870 RepID=A0A1V8SNV1_9PEZI|nr:hypothetical protein B0A48_13466 [Cryoendolithus antarcticus]
MGRYENHIRHIHSKLSEVSPTHPPQSHSALQPPLAVAAPPARAMAAFPLHLLPEELLQSILSHLAKPDHLSLNLTSSWLRRKAAPHAWRHVLLTDCRSEHRGEVITRTSGAGAVRTSGIPAGATVAGDEHDDTPALRKLWVLATTPWLAREVVEVTYQCHLPPPAVFAELPRCGFGGQTLSCDPRTIRLIQVAVANLTRVSTLRVIFGHARFTEALVRSLFAKGRVCELRVRRLWLECVRLNEGLEVLRDLGQAWDGYGLPTRLDFRGLETMRLRRLPLEVKDLEQDVRMTDRSRIVYARGGRATEMQNGLGGHYLTSVNTLGAEVVIADEQLDLTTSRALYDDVADTLAESGLRAKQNPQDTWPIESLFKAANAFDDAIYEELEQNVTLPYQVRNAHVSSHRDRSMLAFCDRWPSQSQLPTNQPDALNVCQRLFRMNGPTAGASTIDTDLDRRVQVVVERLGRTLIDLRVDVQYSGNGEWQSADTAPREVDKADTIRRRRFITEFAALQTTVKTLKVEGGLPRDERREVIRAMHRCPIEKIVLIGVCYPIGNTWGTRGREMAITDGQAQIDDRIFLEAEDTTTIDELGVRTLEPPSSGFTYSPSFTWHNAAPMLHTIASYHSSTLRELKFCGYKGAPILLNPTPITTPFLHALKHCHKLETLITSFWLSTHFEGSPRDDQVISYWMDTRSPSSTAIVAPFWADPPATGTWAYELKTKFAPDALAWRITSFLGPFLSEEAKGRKRGVKVRASFCVGDWGGIFDVDVRIGKGAVGSDVCLGWEGPREELEEGRRKGKSEGRGWF